MSLVTGVAASENGVDQASRMKFPDGCEWSETRPEASLLSANRTAYPGVYSTC